ncbi:MAG: hypothetical protein ACRER2_07565 [Methylococcales bacterium]
MQLVIPEFSNMPRLKFPVLLLILCVSLSGILAPFVLSCILGFFLVRSSGFFSDKVVTWEAMFLVGASMLITAFPRLARIIYERGFSGTSLGTLALAAGLTMARLGVIWRWSWQVLAATR